MQPMLPTYGIVTHIMLVICGIETRTLPTYVTYANTYDMMARHILPTVGGDVCMIL